MKEKVLTPPESSTSTINYALCCDLSNSGEIVVVGYQDGSIHMFLLLLIQLRIDIIFKVAYTVVLSLVKQRKAF